MYWDNDAYGFFDGEATAQHTTVAIEFEGRIVARGLEKHEVRAYLIRHFKTYGPKNKKEAKSFNKINKSINRLDYALTNRNIELQVTCENRLGVRILTQSRGEWII